jgi:hypothetical protein
MRTLIFVGKRSRVEPRAVRDGRQPGVIFQTQAQIPGQRRAQPSHQISSRKRSPVALRRRHTAGFVFPGSSVALWYIFTYFI